MGKWKKKRIHSITKTKQINRVRVESQVRTLKQQLETIEGEHLFKSYRILAKIFDLRSETNSKYKLVDLYNEVGHLFESFSQLYRLMLLQHLNKQSWNMIKQDKLKIVEVIQMLYATPKLLEDWTFQNKFFEMYSKKKWKTSVGIKYLRQIYLKRREDLVRSYNTSKEVEEEIKEVLKYKSRTAVDRCMESIEMTKSILNREYHGLTEKEKKSVQIAVSHMKSKTLKGKWVFFDKEAHNLLQEAYDKANNSHDWILKRGLKLFIKHQGKYVSSK